MKVSYYPGCSLLGTAREYDESNRAVCGALGIELEELEGWNCCGATSAHSTDDYLALALPARNLVIADGKGLDLIVPCSACFLRLKASEKKLLEMPLADFPYRGSLKVKHLLNFLAEDENIQKIQERVKKPLAGLKVACYYGCLIVRPPKVTGATEPEDPKEMDRLMAALGAEVIEWSFKTECCGGSLVLARPDIATKLVERILKMAKEAGAEALVSCCPMCQSNLETCQGESSHRTPVFYFTELLGLALGLSGVKGWLKRHLIDPRQPLREKGLI
ncbi:MAG: disulfide reductase [Deltaproteobacteria bacterium]|nr:MAG: disulfide reductase [Deltaproteobacteria bacterium]